MSVENQLQPNHHAKIFENNPLSKYTNYYTHRDVLEIPHSGVGNGPGLSIMTYNVMGTCSLKRYDYEIRKRLFVVMAEIAEYDSDIICLQELCVDFASIFEFYFKSIGYSMKMSKHNNRNTMAILYKRDLLSMVDWEVENLFETFHSSHGYQYRVPASAMLMSFQFKDEFLKGYTKPTKSGLIIVNTHLTCLQSHLKSTCQTAAIMKLISEYSEKCAKTFSIPSSYVFLAGDFNTSPNEPAYLSLVSKPFTCQSNFYIEADEFDELAEVHNSFNLRAISLYGTGYRHVHPSNIDLDRRGEPKFSFWGPSWQGILDYLFVICDWSGENVTSDNTLDQLADASGVRLFTLLRMPMEKELNGPIPQVGLYPSDHLCMMVNVVLI